MPSQSKMKEWVKTNFHWKLEPIHFPSGFYFRVRDTFPQCGENQTNAVLAFAEEKINWLAIGTFNVREIKVCPLPAYRSDGYLAGFRVFVSVAWHYSPSAYAMRYHLLQGKKVSVQPEPLRSKGKDNIEWILKPFIYTNPSGLPEMKELDEMIETWKKVCPGVCGECAEDICPKLCYEESDSDSDSEETLPSEQAAPEDPLGSRECNTGETSSDSDSDSD